MLRRDLQQAQNEGKSPIEFNPTILNLNIAQLNITAANKRQMAIPASFNLSGHMSMFSTLDIRTQTLRANKEFTTQYIRSFGNAWQPQRHFGRSFFVENVEWDSIRAFFNGFNRSGNCDDKFNALQTYIADKNLTQCSWSVIVPGVERDCYGTVSISETPIENLGISSRRVKRYREGDWVSFQSISAYEDMLADLHPEEDFESDGRWRSSEGVASYRYRATRHGRNNTPLLLLKPIAPKQKSNQPDQPDQLVQLDDVLWSYYVFCPSLDGLVGEIITGWKVGNMFGGNEVESEI